MVHGVEEFENEENPKECCSGICALVSTQMQGLREAKVELCFHGILCRA